MTDAARWKLEEVDLLLALVVQGEQAFVGILLPANCANSEIPEGQRTVELALRTRIPASLDLEGMKNELVTEVLTYYLLSSCVHIIVQVAELSNFHSKPVTMFQDSF